MLGYNQMNAIANKLDTLFCSLTVYALDKIGPVLGPYVFLFLIAR